MTPIAPIAGAADGATPSIRTIACMGGISLERNVPIEEIQDYLSDPDYLIWMDIQDPGPEELSILLDEFGFHPLALEDVAKGGQRPKVDEYKGYVFLVTHGVAPVPGGAFETEELNLFIGRNYIVTCHRGRAPALEDALGRWTRGGALLKEGVGFLAYTIMDALIDTYAPVLNSIEDELEDMELAIFTEFREAGVQHLLRLKRTLVTLRRLLYPLREIFGVLLRRDHPLFSAATLEYMQDVHDHILRMLDALDLEREMASGALDAYMAVKSDQLNTTMKTLTILSIIVGTVGCVFGAWGMNTGGIPFHAHAGGFWLILGGTLALIVGGLLWGRKRGWL